MVQGHTIHVLLSQDLRTTELPVYAIWYFMRGMTAPIFMFSAGTVFIYLFRSVKKPFNQNYRVKKGIKRAALLIFLGYMLRYPTWTIFDFSKVSDESIRSFFAVDVLQLIGFSLLILLLILLVTEKLKLNYTGAFIVTATFFLLSSPFIENINWSDFLPLPLAAYFYSGLDSSFPLFPWAGYVIAGGVLGNYLAENPMVFKTSRFSLLFAIFGGAFFLVAMFSELLLQEFQIQIRNPQTTPHVIFFRVGFVFMLTSLVSFISIRIEKIPYFLILVGRNTLLIYIVHLIILYGSAWTPGVNILWGYSFSGWQSFGAALIMITLMTFVVLIIHRLKIRNKELVT